jgi:hypothetical protein
MISPSVHRGLCSTYCTPLDRQLHGGSDARHMPNMLHRAERCRHTMYVWLYRAQPRRQDRRHRMSPCDVSPWMYGLGPCCSYTRVLTHNIARVNGRGTGQECDRFRFLFFACIIRPIARRHFASHASAGSSSRFCKLGVCSAPSSRGARAVLAAYGRRPAERKRPLACSGLRAGGRSR